MYSQKEITLNSYVYCDSNGNQEPCIKLKPKRTKRGSILPITKGPLKEWHLSSYLSNKNIDHSEFLNISTKENNDYEKSISISFSSAPSTLKANLSVYEIDISHLIYVSSNDSLNYFPWNKLFIRPISSFFLTVSTFKVILILIIILKLLN